MSEPNPIHMPSPNVTRLPEPGQGNRLRPADRQPTSPKHGSPFDMSPLASPLCHNRHGKSVDDDDIVMASTPPSFSSSSTPAQPPLQHPPPADDGDDDDDAVDGDVEASAMLRSGSSSSSSNRRSRRSLSHSTYDSPQFTLRAVVVGLLVGTVVSAVPPFPGGLR